MNNYRFVISPRQTDDPRSAGYLADAHALGLTSVSRLRCHDLYFIEGQLSPDDLQRLAVELLSDPVTQTFTFTHIAHPSTPTLHNPEQPPLAPIPYSLVEVALRPGVTDPVAEQIVRAAHELGIVGVERASTGLRFEIELGEKEEINRGERGERREKERIEQELHHGDTEAQSSINTAILHLLAKRLLANAVIQRYAIGEIEPVFPHLAEASGRVETLPVRDLDEAGLLALSRERRAALDLAEMPAIQAYFPAEGRDPTEVEVETIAQTWSEHCGHKTFKAKIPPTQPSPIANSSEGDGQAGGEINGLLRTYIRSATEQIAAPWVRSAFVDNAGIIDFDDTYEVSFKVETHNHPSAIEPFGGANTGVGGVIRDVLGVSAKPIANTDVLCFGPQDAHVDSLPEGVLHPRRIQSGVVAGVQDYGNKIGIPTVNGAILYDEGYTANPLVFCGCVGIAPKGSHPRQPRPGDRVIVLGGGTGRDGLRGATFSSMTMDAQTGEVSGASVQIGDPITEKGLIEVLLRARDQQLYHAVTDCGAGGLSSAVGEMSSTIGADVELKQVRLKYAGLAPWEIWLSEAQERMVFAVPTEHLASLHALCDIFDVHLTDIGEFTGAGRLVVRYNGSPVLDLQNHFLHDGIPQRQLIAEIHRGERGERREEIRFNYGEHRKHGEKTNSISLGDTESTEKKNNVINHKIQKDLKTPCLGDSVVGSMNDTLLALLAHPNIASKAPVIRIYDHEVQGGTVIKPLTGVENDGPSDACVLKPIGAQGRRGLVLSNGINPEYGKLDAYHMAWSVIDEAIRNAVAVGCDPARIALLDNFCWGDPLKPETLGSLVEACRGCHDAALHYQAPFISGKDSLNNEYLGSDGQRHAIPPTLLISAIGILEDVGRAVTMDLKQAGDLLYLVGEFQPAWGGSHFATLPDNEDAFNPPAFSEAAIPGIPAAAPRTYRLIHQAMQAGLVGACHDLSEGGLAVTAGEVCIGGRLGLEITENLVVYGQKATANNQIFEALLLFGETNGCLLVEVRPGNQEAFERCLAGAAFSLLGRVTSEPVLSIVNGDEILIRLPVEDLVKAWGPK